MWNNEEEENWRKTTDVKQLYTQDNTGGSKDNDDSDSMTAKKTTTGKNINEHTGNELLLMIFCMLQNFWGGEPCVLYN